MIIFGYYITRKTNIDCFYKLYRKANEDCRKIQFLYNEANKDIKEQDNAITIAYKKIEKLESQVKSLRGKIGGLTKENNKLKNMIKKPIVKKLRPTKPKKQEMGIKRTKAGIGARNVLKRTNDLREPTAEDYMLEILKKRSK